MMKKRWLILILAIIAVLAAATLAQTTGTSTTSGSGTGTSSLPACSDTSDNDGDNKIDYPTDPGCLNATDTNESDIVAAAINPFIDPAGARTITYSVNPTVRVGFSEFIVLKSANLYALNDETLAMLAMGISPPSIPVTTINDTMSITAIPLVNLFNGLYDLVLNVEDLVGNPAIVHQKFIIDAPVTDIIITQPRLGVSNGSSADLVIETKRNNNPENTLCKVTTSPFVYDFESSALVPFDAVYAPTHTFANFFTNAYFSESAVFYILCKDTSLQRVNRERFEIYIDSTPPGIASFDFYPPKVVEYPEFENRMWVILNVTGNEDIMCRYSVNESKDYDGMTKFPGYDLNNFYAYSKKNNTIKYYLPDVSPAAHDFYVQCEDRAGWKSSAAKKTLQVDLSAGLEMTVIEPKPYTTNKSITLKMSTIKRAVCVIGNSSIDYTMMNTDGTAKTHAYYLGQFTDGTYTYKMKCTSQSVGGLFVQEQELEYIFVVDNTKPSAPNMTGSRNTCFQTKFELVPAITMTATDIESGISHYFYKMDSTKPMLNWTRTNGEISVIDSDYKGDELNLTKAASYRLSAKAVNGAGLEGPEASVTLTYNPDDINCFEKNPPLIVLAKNATEGKTLVEITCTDESGCDNESYYYGLCDSETCGASTKLDYPFIITIYNTKYLAYNVSDIHGYSASGTEKVEVTNANTCGNSIKDGEETDIDCGGKCNGCELGKSCTVNTDCKSNACSNNICIGPKCDDKETNGPYGNEETDMDCGGYCGATCDLNMTCKGNNDCLSGFCNPSAKKCDVAGCDDGFKNGNEMGVDCGGDCDKDCNDKDGDGLDDDWEEKYCEGDCNLDDDLDKDGLSNLREFQLKTDPTKWDTDGDGYSDGDEVNAGTDPLDPDSYPKSIAGILLMIMGFLFTAGGTGYLVYKKYYLEKPSPGAPASQTGKGQPVKTPEQIAAERKAFEEQQKVAMEQRRKEMEERQKRFDELRARIAEKRESESAKKREERQSLFGKFRIAMSGMPGAMPEQKTGQMAEKIDATKKIETKPRIEVSAKIKPSARIERPEMPKDEWVSIDRLKAGFGEVAKKAAEQSVKAEEKRLAEAKETEFSKLEEMTQGKGKQKTMRKTGAKGPAGEEEEGGEDKEDVFEEMKKTLKEEENPAGKEEDVYRNLGEISKGKERKKPKR